MPIPVSCAQCHTTLNAPDNAAGRKVRCPKCSTAFAVPAVEEDVAIEAVAPSPRPARQAPSGPLQLIYGFDKILLPYPARRISLALKDQFIVRLTAAQRDELERLAATGKRSAALITRVRILLKADADRDGWADDRIAEALDTSAATVARIRKKFVHQGLEAAVQRQRPTGRQYRKLDGAQEARLAALACSPPPAGQARWTMKLLADKLVELEVVQSIDPATVCRTLTKTRSSRG
ncbi:MAG TPA: helix-turn-helix domain-containing protein [Gemmataceae bacterium]|nr:helix-turn-helix domain-containing protein [Gemmataceae bacterium]